MMNLPVSRPICYADNAGRSGDRRCWRATCQGIPRNGSSRRCVWDGELYYSSSPNTHRIESRQCLKKRKRNPVIPPDADYLNLFGKSPVPAEAIHDKVNGQSEFKISFVFEKKRFSVLLLEGRPAYLPIICKNNLVNSEIITYYCGVFL